MTRTGVERPELFAALCVKSKKVTFDIAGEEHISGGDQQRGKNRILERQRPFLLAGDRIERIEVRANLSIRRRLHINIAGDERSAFAGFLWEHRYIRAPLDAVVVPKARARAVCRMIPASASAPVRADEICFTGFGFIASD